MTCLYACIYLSATLLLGHFAFSSADNEPVCVCLPSCRCCFGLFRHHAAVRHLRGHSVRVELDGRGEHGGGIQPGQRGSPQRGQPGEHHQQRYGGSALWAPSASGCLWPCGSCRCADMRRFWGEIKSPPLPPAEDKKKKNSRVGHCANQLPRTFWRTGAQLHTPAFHRRRALSQKTHSDNCQSTAGRSGASAQGRETSIVFQRK